MKRLLVVCMLLVFHQVSQAQIFGKDPILNLQNEDKQFLNWGYYLGFNQYDFQFEYENDTGQDVLVNTTLGFNVGLIGEMRIMEFLDLRFEPGLLYTQRDLGFPGFTSEQDAFREVRSTYIRFPLLLKVMLQQPC